MYATGIINPKPATTTSDEPLKMPMYSGTLTSNNLLCNQTEIDATMIAPTIPVSSVLMLAIIVRPLPGFAAWVKSTPNDGPHKFIID